MGIIELGTTATVVILVAIGILVGVVSALIGLDNDDKSEFRGVFVLKDPKATKVCQLCAIAVFLLTVVLFLCYPLPLANPFLQLLARAMLYILLWMLIILEFLVVGGAFASWKK